MKEIYNEDNPRFWSLNLEKNNIQDLKDWIEKNKLVGIVDEEEGGIIGYISDDFIDKIVNKLNKNYKMKRKENYSTKYEREEMCAKDSIECQPKNKSKQEDICKKCGKNIFDIDKRICGTSWDYCICNKTKKLK